MDYLFHQIMIFIVTVIYIPLIIFQIICIIKATDWRYYLLHTIVILFLMSSLPITLMNYQQYIMGYFSGLPETITKMIIIGDIIIFILILAIIAVFITDNIMIRKSDRDIKLLKNKIEKLKREHLTWDKKLNLEKHIR